MSISYFFHPTSDIKLGEELSRSSDVTYREGCIRYPTPPEEKQSSQESDIFNAPSSLNILQSSLNSESSRNIDLSAYGSNLYLDSPWKANFLNYQECSSTENEALGDKDESENEYEQEIRKEREKREGRGEKEKEELEVVIAKVDRDESKNDEIGGVIIKEHMVGSDAGSKTPSQLAGADSDAGAEVDVENEVVKEVDNEADNDAIQSTSGNLGIPQSEGELIKNESAGEDTDNDSDKMKRNNNKNNNQNPFLAETYPPSYNSHNWKHVSSNDSTNESNSDDTWHTSTAGPSCDNNSERNNPDIIRKTNPTFFNQSHISSSRSNSAVSVSSYYSTSSSSSSASCHSNNQTKPKLQRKPRIFPFTRKGNTLNTKSDHISNSIKLNRVPRKRDKFKILTVLVWKRCFSFKPRTQRHL